MANSCRKKRKINVLVAESSGFLQTKTAAESDECQEPSNKKLMFFSTSENSRESTETAREVYINTGISNCLPSSLPTELPVYPSKSHEENSHNVINGQANGTEQDVLMDEESTVQVNETLNSGENCDEEDSYSGLGLASGQKSKRKRFRRHNRRLKREKKKLLELVSSTPLTDGKNALHYVKVKQEPRKPGKPKCSITQFKGQRTVFSETSSLAGDSDLISKNLIFELNDLKSVSNNLESASNNLGSAPNNLESASNNLESASNNLGSSDNLGSASNNLESASNNLESASNNLGSSDNLGSASNNLGSASNNLRSAPNNLESSLDYLESASNNLGSSDNLGSASNNLGSASNNLESAANNLESTANNLESAANNLESASNNLESASNRLNSASSDSDSSSTSSDCTLKKSDFATSFSKTNSVDMPSKIVRSVCEWPTSCINADGENYLSEMTSEKKMLLLPPNSSKKPKQKHSSFKKKNAFASLTEAMQHGKVSVYRYSPKEPKSPIKSNNHIKPTNVDEIKVIPLPPNPTPFPPVSDQVKHEHFYLSSVENAHTPLVYYRKNINPINSNPVLKESSKGSSNRNLKTVRKVSETGLLDLEDKVNTTALNEKVKEPKENSFHSLDDNSCKENDSFLSIVTNAASPSVMSKNCGSNATKKKVRRTPKVVSSIGSLLQKLKQNSEVEGIS